MKKSEIRKLISNKRNNMDKNDVAIKSRIICEKISTLPIFVNAKNVLIYISMKNEVNLKYLFDCFHKTKQFYSPICINKELMTFAKIDSYENLVESNRFKGLYEPAFNMNTNNKAEAEILDLVIVPGLAFDNNKDRLGYGAGYYDRFFSLLNYSPIKLGVCYSFQLITSIPSSEKDVKMDYILTEKHFI